MNTIKKLLILIAIMSILLTGCSQKETNYTPDEIKQILLDNGFKYLNEKTMIFYLGDTYSLMFSNVEETGIHFFQFSLGNDSYGESHRKGGTEIFANVHIGDEACFYSFTEKKLDDSNPDSCGQLAIEKSKKMKQEFEDFLKELGISKNNFSEFIENTK